MARIALFGGAFDPPHLGHLLCACYAWHAESLDAIWVLPSAVHPWAKTMRPFADRLHLCALTFADLPFVEVHDDERHNASGRTFDLMSHLSKVYPAHRWWWIGGTDTHQQMPQWYRGNELAELLTPIPIPRRGYDDTHPAALPAISSSAIRELLARGADASALLPTAVVNHLSAKGWYQRTGDRTSPHTSHHETAPDEPT